MVRETCSAFKICGACYELRGFWLYQGRELQQECECTYSRVRAGFQPAPARWPVNDFNEVVTLCYCCGAELLRSGSKWSVWFCEECKGRVRALNVRYQRCLIPIGRHSVMNGFAVRGRDAQVPAAVEQFVLCAEALQDRTGLLNHWAAAIVAETARTRGFQEGEDVPLLDYLKALARWPADKASAFARLCVYFQNPRAAQT